MSEAGAARSPAQEASATVHVDPALDASPAAVVTVLPDGSVVRWNAACARLAGIEAEAALGAALSSLLRFEPRDTTGLFPERHWAVTPERRVPVELTTWSSVAGGVTLVHHWLRDSTARVSHEHEVDHAVAVLRRQARSDALTGLANRYELEERLEAAIRTGTPRVALVAVDLDGFKPVNDAFGHAVGDEVLTAVAARLLASVRADDLVSRVGGDEFVVLARLGSEGDPSELTSRIEQALVGPLATSAGLLSVGASVGIAVSELGQDPGELLRLADKAMYRSKAGRSRPASPRPGGGRLSG